MTGLATQAGMAGKKAAGGGSYLLDSYSAGVAYALKVLSSSFASADLILARRDSDAAEQGFTQAEIEDGTLTTWGSGTNVRVKTLYDQSGNGHDITQATVGDMPLLMESGTLNTLAGEPTMRLDGDHLSGSVNLTSDAAGSAFYVARMFSDPSMISSDGPSGDFDMLGRSASGATASFGSPVYRFNGVSKPAVDDRPEIITECLGIDNIIGVTGLNYGANYSTFRLGGRTFEWEGTISAAIVFDSDQSANYSDIETELNSLYSIY